MLADSWIVKLGVIGAILAFISTSIQKRLDRMHEQECLSVALKCEIKSILAKTERAKLVEMGEQYLKRMRAGENLQMPRMQDKEIRQSEILQTMYPIFHAHMKDIGILDKDKVEQLATFYSNCMTLQGTLLKSARGEWDDWPLDNKIQILEFDLELWQHTKAIGEKLIIDLDQTVNFLNLW